MQPFTIAAFTFGTKNGTVPEIGTYKIIGFSVANELSIGIDLNKRMLRRLRGTCPPKGIKVLSAKGIVSSYYQFLSDTQRYAAHIIKNDTILSD